jgi:uncharacterized protein (DUF362 family)
MGTVTVIYGNDPRKMLQQVIAATGVLDFVRSHDRVVLKPNLVVSRREWQGVNTDPRVVEAMVEALQQRGVAHITVADGSGMGYNATKAFSVCGYTDLAKRYGVTLVDLERDRFGRRPVQVDGPFRSLEIARTVLDCDVLINLPVLKAHSITRVTCSLKNLKGVMPRSTKTAFHSRGLHRAIAQLNTVLTPDLIVVDGLQGDLSSETGRTPVVMERLLVGHNQVEVDSVAADMLGYAPRSIRHIARSEELGLGTCDLKQIEVQALNRPTRQAKFAPMPHYTRRFPCHISAEGACCTCMGNLLFALSRLREQGLLSRKQALLVGQHPAPTPHNSDYTIAVGQCAAEAVEADLSINVCPPSTGLIQKRVAAMVQEQSKI